MAEDFDRIDRLQKRLYSRGKKDAHKEERHGFREPQYEVGRSWERERPRDDVAPRKKRLSGLSLFFVASIVFFAVSVAFGSFYFFAGQNVVSSKNVDIDIQGPTSIGGGDELDLQITITNKNNTTLQLADLLVEYPEGTRAAENTQNELLRYRESLGDIAPGEKVKKTVRAVLFGEENSQKDIPVTIEYRVEGSNAIFYAEETYQVTLSTAPISVSVRSLDEVVSGQDIEFEVLVGSNVASVVENLVLQAEYPFGFSFTSADPKANFSDSLWELGNLKPEEKRTIHITGRMSGQDDEERVFRFAAGVRDIQNVNKLSTTYVSSVRSVTITQPFLGATLSLNDQETQSYVFEAGDRIQGQIVWKNNLTDQITDGEVEVRLSGGAVDEQSVLVEGGFYDSVNDTLRWSKETREDLAVLEPTQLGALRFSFAGKNLTDGSLKNPEIVLEVTVRGKRMSSSNVPEQIDSTVTRRVKLLSNLRLTPRIVHSVGPFANTGPLPPRAEQQTTYTAMLSVTNGANHVSDVRVTATLPSYVRWLGAISPNSANVTFNASNNQITWIVGEMPQQIGTSVSPKEVAFQIGFTPSVSQVGQAPILVDTLQVRGFDQFTDSQFSRTALNLTTALSTDPAFQSGQDTVSP